jgi:hypothetical protein
VDVNGNEFEERKWTSQWVVIPRALWNEHHVGVGCEVSGGEEWVLHGLATETSPQPGRILASGVIALDAETMEEFSMDEFIDTVAMPFLLEMIEETVREPLGLVVNEPGRVRCLYA